MFEVDKQALAEQDLIDIWCYSFEQWGSEQADLYLSQLAEGISRLGKNPKIGVAVDHIRENYRRHHIRRHMVYYRVTRDQVEIIRVLHESMDPDSHL